jgi:hypothetical protein
MPTRGRPANHAKRRQVATLSSRGLSARAIARRLGISHQGVLYLLHAAAGASEARSISCPSCGTAVPVVWGLTRCPDGVTADSECPSGQSRGVWTAGRTRAAMRARPAGSGRSEPKCRSGS